MREASVGWDYYAQPRGLLLALEQHNPALRKLVGPMPLRDGIILAGQAYGLYHGRDYLGSDGAAVVMRLITAHVLAAGPIAQP